MAAGGGRDRENAGEQEERSGERGGRERVERENGARRVLNRRRGRNRIGRVDKNRNDGLQQPQGLMRFRRRYSLRVGIRGESGEAGEQ